MTNEQAIKILTEAGFGINIWNTPTGYCEEDWDEALQMAIEALSAQPERGNDSTWELFDLITSAYHGKQYYFPQYNGLVYSRASHEYMSVDDAIGEFLKEISNG